MKEKFVWKNNKDRVEIIKVSSLYNDLPPAKKVELLQLLAGWVNKELTELDNHKEVDD